MARARARRHDVGEPGPRGCARIGAGRAVSPWRHARVAVTGPRWRRHDARGRTTTGVGSAEPDKEVWTDGWSTTRQPRCPDADRAADDPQRDHLGDARGYLPAFEEVPRADSVSRVQGDVPGWPLAVAGRGRAGAGGGERDAVPRLPADSRWLPRGHPYHRRRVPRTAPGRRDGRAPGGRAARNRRASAEQDCEPGRTRQRHCGDDHGHPPSPAHRRGALPGL